MSRFKRLLVPTDFSPTAGIALQYAVDIAPAGASIHVIHVVDETGLLAAYPEGMFLDPAVLRADLVESAQRQLADAIGKVSSATATVTLEVLVGRPVSAVVVEAAKARKSDLIVMGTHGRNAFARLMLGSVAERVLRTAPCPVVTVRDNSRTADAIADEMSPCARPPITDGGRGLDTCSMGWGGAALVLGSASASRPRPSAGQSRLS